MLGEARSLPFTDTACTPEYGVARTGSVVTLHRALEEDLQVEALPCAGQVQTEVVARRAVTNDAAVARFVGGILAGVHLAVAIQIGVHDVTSTPVATQSALIYLGQVLVHLFLCLGNTNGGVAPNVAQVGSAVVVAQLACGVGVLVNLHAAVGQGKGYAIVKVANLVAPAYHQVKTFRGHIQVVHLRGRGTQYGRKLGSRAYHVEGLTAEDFERTGQAIVEGTPVKTDVQGLRLFPGQRRRDESRLSGRVGLLAVHQPVATHVRVADGGIEGIPVGSILVTQFTPRNAELQGVNILLQ